MPAFEMSISQANLVELIPQGEGVSENDEKMIAKNMRLSSSDDVNILSNRTKLSPVSAHL